MCDRAIRKGSLHKEETERLEVEKTDTMLKKLEKKAKAVENFKK